MNSFPQISKINYIPCSTLNSTVAFSFSVFLPFSSDRPRFKDCRGVVGVEGVTAAEVSSCVCLKDAVCVWKDVGVDGVRIQKFVGEVSASGGDCVLNDASLL